VDDVKVKDRRKWGFVIGWMAVIYGIVTCLGVLSVIANRGSHLVDLVLSATVCVVCAAGWAAIRTRP
jgi:hypothetical protein